MEESIDFKTVLNGRVDRRCWRRKTRSKETDSPVPSPIRCGNQDSERCWINAKTVENIQKGSNFIADGTTQKDYDLNKGKDIECPNLVSWLRISEPNIQSGGSLWQASDLETHVVKVGPGVDVGYPLQRTTQTTRDVVSLMDSTDGTITRPNGLVEATPAEVSSTERIASQTIELSGMIHRRPIRVLLDSGSTGNNVSDRVA